MVRFQGVVALSPESRGSALLRRVHSDSLTVLDDDPSASASPGRSGIGVLAPPEPAATQYPCKLLVSTRFDLGATVVQPIVDLAVTRGVSVSLLVVVPSDEHALPASSYASLTSMLTSIPVRIAAAEEAQRASRATSRSDSRVSSTFGSTLASDSHDDHVRQERHPKTAKVVVLGGADGQHQQQPIDLATQQPVAHFGEVSSELPRDSAWELWLQRHWLAHDSSTTNNTFSPRRRVHAAIIESQAGEPRAMTPAELAEMRDADDDGGQSMTTVCGCVTVAVVPAPPSEEFVAAMLAMQSALSEPLLPTLAAAGGGTFSPSISEPMPSFLLDYLRQYFAHPLAGPSTLLVCPDLTPVASPVDRMHAKLMLSAVACLHGGATAISPPRSSGEDNTSSPFQNSGSAAAGQQHAGGGAAASFPIVSPASRTAPPLVDAPHHHHHHSHAAEIAAAAAANSPSLAARLDSLLSGSGGRSVSPSEAGMAAASYALRRLGGGAGGVVTTQSGGVSAQIDFGGGAGGAVNNDSGVVVVDMDRNGSRTQIREYPTDNDENDEGENEDSDNVSGSSPAYSHSSTNVLSPHSQSNVGHRDDRSRHQHHHDQHRHHAHRDPHDSSHHHHHHDNSSSSMLIGDEFGYASREEKQQQYQQRNYQQPNYQQQGNYHPHLDASRASSTHWSPDRVARFAALEAELQSVRSERDQLSNVVRRMSVRLSRTQDALSAKSAEAAKAAARAHKFELEASAVRSNTEHVLAAMRKEELVSGRLARKHAIQRLEAKIDPEGVAAGGGAAAGAGAGGGDNDDTPSRAAASSGAGSSAKSPSSPSRLAAATRLLMNNAKKQRTSQQDSKKRDSELAQRCNELLTELARAQELLRLERDEKEIMRAALASTASMRGAHLSATSHHNANYNYSNTMMHNSSGGGAMIAAHSPVAVVPIVDLVAQALARGLDIMASRNSVMMAHQMPLRFKHGAPVAAAAGGGAASSGQHLLSLSSAGSVRDEERQATGVALQKLGAAVERLQQPDPAAAPAVPRVVVSESDLDATQAVLRAEIGRLQHLDALLVPIRAMLLKSIALVGDDGALGADGLPAALGDVPFGSPASPEAADPDEGRGRQQQKRPPPKQWKKY